MPKFLTPIDMSNLEVTNLKLHNSPQAAGSGPYLATVGKGSIFFNTTTGVNRPHWSDGTSWQQIYPFSTTAAGTAVLRDSNGDFTAGTITANLTGTASIATRLATQRMFVITGKASAVDLYFDGTQDINLSINSLYVVPSDITLNSGLFITGAANNKGQATLKSDISITGFGSPIDHLSMNNFKITNLANPQNPLDAANKYYVDNVATGLDVKQSCRVSTTVNIPGSSYSSATKTIAGSVGGDGTLVLDGVTVAMGDRVLVKDQTDRTQNGIYTVTRAGSMYLQYILTRAEDFDTSAEASPGSFTFIEEGTTNADTGWVMKSDQVIALDTSNIDWIQFSGAGSITVGRGLNRSGNVINFGSANTDYTTGALPYASGTTTIGFISAVATGNVLLSGGIGSVPTWGQVNLGVHVTGTLSASLGGTGQSNATAGSVLYGTGSAFALASGTSGYFMRWGGTGAPTALDLFGTANTWTANQTFNVGTTPANAITIDINALAAAGTRQSNKLRFVGRTFDTGAHNVDWELSVIPGTNDGATSTFKLQSRVDAASFTDILSITKTTGVSYSLNAGTFGFTNGSGFSWTLGNASVTANRTLTLPDATGTVALTTNTTFGSGSTWNGNIIGGAYGGTGNGFFSVSGPTTTVKTYTFKDFNSNIPVHKTGTITGNGTLTQFSATHSLGSKDVIVSLFDSSDNQVFTDTKTLDTNNVQFTFSVAPTNGTTYRWVVVGF